MAAKKNKYYRVILRGTGVNEQFLVSSHDILALAASTYHKFTFPDGRVLLRNDFGVSSVLVIPIDLSQDEFDQMAGSAS